jgi:hypothetical protein
MSKKNLIKVSHPLNWLNHGHWPYENHFPGRKKEWDIFQFEINNDAVTECDIWVVHESVDKTETVKCNADSVILVVSEETQQVPNYDPKYLDQFSLVITSRGDLVHPNVFRTFNMNPWRVNKTYDEINKAISNKTNSFSAVVSNNVSTAGHLKRFSFAHRLKGHFKNRMNWFGKGENEIKDKWDALYPYRYSLAIENCSVPFYFTEKIMDCYCALSMPIYAGCTNIFDFFPKESLVLVDTNALEEAIEKIEDAILGDRFSKNFDALMEAKNLVLNKYQFIPAVSNVIREKLNLNSGAKEKIKIHPSHPKVKLSSRIIKRFNKL